MSKKQSNEAQVAVLQAECEADEAEVNFLIAQKTGQLIISKENSDAMAEQRGSGKATKNLNKGRTK